MASVQLCMHQHNNEINNNITTVSSSYVITGLWNQLFIGIKTDKFKSNLILQMLNLYFIKISMYLIIE